jgi:hypothetical protein
MRRGANGVKALGQFMDLYARIGEQRFDEGIVLIIEPITHFGDTRRREDFGTVNTWKMAHVSHRAFDRAAAAGRIGDGVLLGVHGSLFMAVAHPGVMWHAGQEAVIARRDQAIFTVAAAHNHTAHL